MTEGWPISDPLIFTDDQILTYSTETKTAENMRMLTHCSMINMEISLLHHGTLPLALCCTLCRFPLLRALGGRHLSKNLA
jgi:hypothetical protein